MNNRHEYVRKKIPQGRTQKLNLVLTIATMAAVVLLAVLSVVKIYSSVQNKKQTDQVKNTASDGTNPNSESQSTETAAQPVSTPRPKAVALTFDDGPSRANDDQILNTLQTYGARATFFVLGDRARVDGDILQKYVAARCEIGSHSWNHPQLSKIKWERVERQLSKTNRIVSKLTNGYQIHYLRPPYGAISKKMRKKLDMPMILWNLDTMDWKTRNPKKIFCQVKKKVQDGDIILMHNIYRSTADALEEVVPWLQSQGYDLLTVSELMARNGKTLENGKAYCDGR